MKLCTIFSFILKILLYILLLLIILFLIWLAVIQILYQNKQCFYINKEKFLSNNFNFSFNSTSIDSRLKLNHFTVAGTHNSYHQANLFYKYEHKSLDKQIFNGIRQIELDIHLMRNNLLVYHLQLFDDKTNCYCFKDCLNKIHQAIHQNNFLYPIYLFIEIKQRIYEDLITGLIGGPQCHHLVQIKEEILDIFSLDTFILPTDVQGNQSSIKVALKQQHLDELTGDYTYKNYGWPPLVESLRKILPVFLDDVHNRALNLYSTCEPLRSFFFIAQKNIELSYSSIITIFNDDKPEKLINIIDNGQVMRILFGYEDKNVEQIYQTTKEFGIHIISSDSEDCTDTPLCQALAKDFRNSTILCNIKSAPAFCNLSLPFL